MHPLDGARLKVVRAQEHLDVFKLKVGAFIDTKPYYVETEVYGEHWWVKPHVTAQPDIGLSAIVGDCVTNARAALDYIMWELSCRHFDSGPNLETMEDRRITAFPIFQNSATAKGYKDRINRLSKRKIPTDALAEITAAQPDVSGDPSLHWLHEVGEPRQAQDADSDRHSRWDCTARARQLAWQSRAYSIRVDPFWSGNQGTTRPSCRHPKR